MITAEIEKTLNSEQYKIKFYGDRLLVNALNCWVNLIQTNNYKVIETVNEFYDNKIAQLQKEYKSTVKQIKQLKHEHILPVVFYKENYKKVKELEEKLNAILDAYDELEERKQDPVTGMLKNSLCKLAYENFLIKNQFQYTSLLPYSYKEVKVFNFIGNQTELLEKVNKSIQNIKAKKDLKTQKELKKAKKFVKEYGIDALIKHYNKNNKQQEIEK